MPRLEFTQDEVDDLKAKLLDLTNATRTVRIGRGQYGAEADVAVQLAAVVKCLEFGVGRPTQKVEHSDAPALPGGATRLDHFARLLRKHAGIVPGILAALSEGARQAEVIEMQTTERIEERAAGGRTDK